MKIRLVFVVIALVFFAIGLVAIFWLFIQPIMLRFDVKNWTQTPCKIVSAGIGKHISGRSIGYTIDITYEYVFNGKPYSSDQYDFVSGYRRDHSRMKKIISHYKAADNPFCYVNPRDPCEAVLQPMLDRRIILSGLCSLFFLYIGGVFLKFAIKENFDDVESQS